MTAAVITIVVPVKAQLANANPATAAADSTVLAQTPFAVGEQGAYFRNWSRTTTTLNNVRGDVLTTTNSYVEVADGLNFQDVKGNWQATREEFAATPDGGFAAPMGQYQLRVGKNLNTPAAITHKGADGIVLKSAPLAIGFYDPVSGKSSPIAQVQDTAPQQVAPNQILFADAFDKLHADYEVTYRQGGMSAEVILREAPTLPAGFSDRTRLEVYTEFTPDTPMPKIDVRFLRQETDPAARANAAEPDFTDEWLNFGTATTFVPGRAFAVDGSATDDVAVGKQFTTTPDGRQILIEAVEFAELKPLLKDLKQAALPKAGRAVVLNGPDPIKDGEYAAPSRTRRRTFVAA